jgi:hypothetical protein
MNITLMERAKSMLSGDGIDNKLCYLEVISIAYYLINMSPTSTLVDNNPMEVWTCKNPSLQHLHVFGCEAYTDVSKEKSGSWITRK